MCNDKYNQGKEELSVILQEGIWEDMSVSSPARQDGKGSHCGEQQWETADPVHLGVGLLRASLDGEVRWKMER